MKPMFAWFNSSLKIPVRFQALLFFHTTSITERLTRVPRVQKFWSSYPKDRPNLELRCKGSPPLQHLRK